MSRPAACGTASTAEVDVHAVLTRRRNVVADHRRVELHTNRIVFGTSHADLPRLLELGRCADIVSETPGYQQDNAQQLSHRTTVVLIGLVVNGTA